MHRAGPVRIRRPGPTRIGFQAQGAPPKRFVWFYVPGLLAGEPLPGGWRDEAHWDFDFRNVRDARVERHLGLTLHQCGLSVIRDTRYKYVHCSALPPLFFDLERDPGEFENQAENPQYRSRVLEYAQRMLSWKMNHTDRGLTETMLGEGGAVTRRAPPRNLDS